MMIFQRGERARIVDSHESDDTYVIQDIKRKRNSPLLYLLRSERDTGLRLYCDSEDTLLKRIDPSNPPTGISSLL